MFDTYEFRRRWLIGKCIDKIILVWNVSGETLSNWIKTLMNKGYNSLKYEQTKGGPVRPTKIQKDKLFALVNNRTRSP